MLRTIIIIGLVGALLYGVALALGVLTFGAPAVDEVRLDGGAPAELRTSAG